MKWVDNRNRNRPCHAQLIIDFCCQQVLPHVVGNHLFGFTEYKGTFNNNYQIFRAHPAYRTDSGQVCGVWYDWAIFDIGLSQTRPCQILCFLDVGELKPGTACIGTQQLQSHHCYVVARPFTRTPQSIRPNPDPYSSLVQMGWLANEPILIDCLCIKDVCSVVQNISCKSNNQLPSVASLGPNTWFLVSNRSDWLEYFAEDHILSFEGEEQNVRSELEAEKKIRKGKTKM